MVDSINTIINQSTMKILRPLIRVLLRNGVSCGSFEELARKAYVDEAFAIGKKNQQKTTVSSVSAQTGLSRKEVKRLNELEQTQHAEVEQKYNRAVRVISGWVNDSGFTDSQGNARVLPLSDEDGSFADLVKQHSGDITTKAMLDLLLNAQCIKIEDNKAHLIKQAYVPGKDPVGIIRILGVDTSELLNTIDYNLSDDNNDKRYQRKVSSALLNQNAIEEFKTLSNKQSQALLEKLDAWISEHEVNSDDENAIYVSLGIYYYEEESSGEQQ